MNCTNLLDRDREHRDAGGDWRRITPSVARLISRGLLAVVAMSALGGCATVQYAGYEKLGIHKRDILVDRVEDARDAQEDTKEEFVSAYENFRNLVGTQGGDLEKKYNKLNAELEGAEKGVADIDGRIKDVERVAADLFAEWNQEIQQYTNQKYRQSSERKLILTRQRYQQLITAMKTARGRVNPVLFVLQDHVLFLKHNLNAQALSSLQNEVGSIESRVDELVREMQTAIDEANSFIADVGAPT